ncbi:unnamed protein product [Didymodactylos carnosus]|uniref:Uncharacterized protein n=1 Tax=Didymodactylos carnosus TaxID=1234261 RepID=A0A816DIW0_9BILA|nr:unnamed protein product [Didymodactylos carnosus]CAF4545968.1 unnamed protein product [Didymodactylos carnosus]
MRFFQKATTTTTPSAASQCQLPSLPCTLVNITYDQLLFLQDMSTGLNVYGCYAYGFYATSQVHTLSFGFRQDPTEWFLNEVFVVANDTNQQLLSNGCSETGDLTGWIYSENNGCGPGWSKVDGNVITLIREIITILAAVMGKLTI